MKRKALQVAALALAPIAALTPIFSGCSFERGVAVKAGTFASVRPVLEANCVHCHGEIRLPKMPSFNDTKALARLKGSWIIPGHPERSRFFQVVTLTDEQPGAMPPTGHAISKAEAEKIRVWIQSGAPLPEGAPVRLAPRGDGPRSQ